MPTALTKSTSLGLIQAAATVAAALGVDGQAPGTGPDADERPGGVIQIRYGNIEPPVVAQRDVTVREVTSIHPLDPAPAPLECSGLAALDGRLLLTSDRHSHVLFTLPVAADGPAPAIGLPEAQPIISLEKHLLLDAESVTTRSAGGRWTAYVLCSLSNDAAGDRRAKRQHMARLRLDRDGAADPASVSVLSAEGVRTALHRHFVHLGVAPYRSFNSEMSRNTHRWGNVEGMAWTPGGETLLCGMRNPTPASDALLFALAGVDAAFDADDPARLEVTDLFRLNLGGRGVSDLAWDPLTEGYLIAAGLSNGPKLHENQLYPLENLGSALFWWSGDKSDRPVKIATVEDLNLDAVCRVRGTTLIALGSDEGDVSEERLGRQSVITLVHFTGVTR